MRSRTSKRISRIIATTFLGGLILIAAPIVARIQQADDVLHVVVRIASGLGEAAIIAAIVAFVFEILLSEERIREIEEIFKLHRRLEKFGFKATYTTRQEVFDEILGQALPRVGHELKIMGICVSLFKESGRGKASAKRETKDSVIDALASMIYRGVTVQVLFLKRTPSLGDLEAGGVPHVDLIYMRERDEDTREEFQHGKRMKKIANRAVADWIEVMLAVAERVKHIKSADERREILHRLQVREYVALPSLSLYIVDDDIYVTPYLFKRHCSDVPAFRVGGKESPLFVEYHNHFIQTWEDDYTLPAIPPRFVERLAEDPKTITEFVNRRDEIQAELQREWKSRSEFSEFPEFYAASERAMYACIEGESRHARWEVGPAIS